MKVTVPEIMHRDERGLIIDVLAEDIDSITYLTMARGAVRGNHYHERTDQWLYVLSGQVRVVSQLPGGDSVTEVLRKGALVENRAMERHAFVALSPATAIAFACGPRKAAEFEADTIRLEPAEFLIDPEEYR